jgi:LacI family transcriptional regulator
MGIKEIAEQAGVSKTTVSLALNGQKGVSYETRMRIIQLAKDMDYRVPGERSYFHENNGTIMFARLRKHGLILNEDQNSFIMDYIDGMNHVVKEFGYTFEIYNHRVEPIPKFLSEVQDKQPKGIILLGTELEAEDILALSELTIPYVVMDTYFEHISVDFVNMANIGAVHNIVDYFSKTNHKDIGMVTCSIKSGNVIVRERGFRLAMDHFSKTIGVNSLIQVRPGFPGAYQDMMGHLKKGNRLPQALFCYNDVAAFGVIKALKESGFSVPADVSIIGFDDLPMSSMMEPHLTTIKVPNKYIGSAAARMLVERLNSKRTHYPTGLLVGGSLIIRESVQERT